jgi:excisionase family DNA binding protein
MNLKPQNETNEIDGDVAKWQLITIPRAAEVLAVSPRYVRMLIAEGAVRTVRFGRGVRIPAAEIARIAQAGYDQKNA